MFGHWCNGERDLADKQSAREHLAKNVAQDVSNLHPGMSLSEMGLSLCVALYSLLSFCDNSHPPCRGTVGILSYLPRYSFLMWKRLSALYTEW